MVNKVIFGGILVTVMGGVPGATYLLTKDYEEKNAPSKVEGSPKQAPSEPNSNAISTDSERNSTPCLSSGDTSDCTVQPRK